jgi:hypothetical protein
MPVAIKIAERDFDELRRLVLADIPRALPAKIGETLHAPVITVEGGEVPGA